jgi:hypothetical protein
VAAHAMVPVDAAKIPKVVHARAAGRKSFTCRAGSVAGRRARRGP